MNYLLVPLRRGRPVKGLCVTKLKRNVEITVFMEALRDMKKYKLNKVNVDCIEIYKGESDNLILLATIYADGI